MNVVALAGGVGAGKFLRGLVSVVGPEQVTVVVNTGDDIVVHGLHVSPDLDSVLYWLAGISDRGRGWGRAAETFRTTEELRRLEAPDAWFGLGDLDLATHLLRTRLLSLGGTLSSATAELARRFGIEVRVLPMSDDPVTTRIGSLDDTGAPLDLHFQEYWVKRGARDEVRGVTYAGAASARPAPGVLEAVAAADAIVICPSNPIASIGPILSVPGLEEAVVARRERVTGISPIVGGAPLRGMADKLLAAAGVEVTAAGVGRSYARLVARWVIDDKDVALAPAVEAAGLTPVVTDTIMVDDAASARLAETVLDGDGTR